MGNGCVGLTRIVFRAVVVAVVGTAHAGGAAAVAALFVVAVVTAQSLTHNGDFNNYLS